MIAKLILKLRNFLQIDDWRASLGKDLKKRGAWVMRNDREKCLGLAEVSKTYSTESYNREIIIYYYDFGLIVIKHLPVNNCFSWQRFSLTNKCGAKLME